MSSNSFSDVIKVVDCPMLPPWSISILLFFFFKIEGSPLLLHGCHRQRCIKAPSCSSGPISLAAARSSLVPLPLPLVFQVRTSVDVGLVCSLLVRMLFFVPQVLAFPSK